MTVCLPSTCKNGASTTCSPNREPVLRKSRRRSRKAASSDETMRIAATADLHFVPANQAVLREQLDQVRNEADVLIIAGDLTNYGKPAEMEPLLNAIVRIRVPTIAVLGNHDFESGCEQELITMMTNAGIKVLDGNAYERDGVGFAGT